MLARLVAAPVRLDDSCGLRLGQRGLAAPHLAQVQARQEAAAAARTDAGLGWGGVGSWWWFKNSDSRYTYGRTLVKAASCFHGRPWTVHMEGHGRCIYARARARGVWRVRRCMAAHRKCLWISSAASFSMRQRRRSLGHTLRHW